MLTPETLDRLDHQSTRYIGLEIATPIAVNPGDLRVLIACYRQHHRPAPTTEKEPAA